MPDLRDLTEVLGGGEQEGKEVRLSPKVKEQAIKMVDDAIEMINKEGLDGHQFIMQHLGGQRALEREASEGSGDRSKKKAAIILMLKRKNDGNQED